MSIIEQFLSYSFATMIHIHEKCFNFIFFNPDNSYYIWIFADKILSLMKGISRTKRIYSKHTLNYMVTIILRVYFK